MCGFHIDARFLPPSVFCSKLRLITRWKETHKKHFFFSMVIEILPWKNHQCCHLWRNQSLQKEVKSFFRNANMWLHNITKLVKLIVFNVVYHLPYTECKKTFQKNVFCFKNEFPSGNFFFFESLIAVLEVYGMDASPVDVEYTLMMRKMTPHIRMILYWLLHNWSLPLMKNRRYFTVFFLLVSHHH